MRDTIKRYAAAALVGALLAVLALLGAATASAHAALISTDPAADTALDAGPARVSATFNEELQPEFASMTVVGPDGNLWSTGAALVDGAVASVELRPLGPAGTYTANYRVTSVDGHVVTGAWTFELTVARTASPGPPVAAATPAGGAATPAGGIGEDIPTWPFVVAAALIVGAGALWAVRRRG